MLLESLETRQHFSVTVTEMYTGFYDVSGDHQADSISITVSQNEESFTLDGVTYTGVAYIFVHGNGGEDFISVTSVDGAGVIGASITGDDGSDQITLNFDGGVWGGAGNDLINLSDSFRGIARGDSGNDDIFISGYCYDAEIVGDVGNDLIDCSNNLYRVVVRAGEGNDTVIGSAYNDQIYADGGVDLLIGGGGDDSFYVMDGRGGQIDGGEGHDIVYTINPPPMVSGVEEIYYF